MLASACRKMVVRRLLSNLGPLWLMYSNQAQPYTSFQTQTFSSPSTSVHMPDLLGIGLSTPQIAARLNDGACVECSSRPTMQSFVLRP